MSSLLNDSFILFFILCISIAFVLGSWLFNSSKPKKNLPPSPRKLPIIGNLHQLGSLPQHSLKSLAEKHGPIMLLHLGSKPTLIISSANAAKEVMKTHDLAFADRPKTYAASKLFYNFKDMVFAPYGDYWRQVRSICVLQLLSNKRVQSFRGIRQEETAAMIEKIRQSCVSSSIINADEIFAELTNNIICRAASGKKYSSEKGGRKFKKLFEDASDLLGAFNVGDYISWLGWINYINGFEAKLDNVTKEMDEYLENILDNENNVQGNAEQQQQQNFASVLLEVQRTNPTISRDCVKGLILNMVLGGTDTTHSLLQWIMTELLRNESAMTRLQKEVREVVGSKLHITEEDVEKMQYLKAVIKETLRLHPPVPLLVLRVAREDVNLMGYDVEKDTQVIVNAWAIGRDPSLWDEAKEFKPERFLNTSMDFKGLNFQFIPFGSGRRSCPGITFAIPVVELALANLMQKFNFALPQGVRGENLDMSDSVGIISQKKIPLLFVATSL